MDYRTLLSFLEEIAPEATAEPWDSVGLMIEPEAHDITRVLVALDATPDVAQEAKDKGCQFVLTHHPLFFRPLARLTADTFEGRTALAFARAGIGLASAHTNLDASPLGTWAALAETLGLPTGQPLPGFPCGCLVEVEEGLPADALIERIRQRLAPHAPSSIGPKKDILRKIAIATGAGADAIPAAEAAGADLLITGELKYHEALPAVHGNLWVITIGHYESERPALKSLIGHLQFRTDGVQSKVEFCLSQDTGSPEKALYSDMEG